uniref:Chemokine interleukin-8-like domain-containing protein n=1 Tax=Denticeps clupeoides TaxID=299321 RepID=A0AAY4BP50_9TELE
TTAKMRTQILLLATVLCCISALHALSFGNQGWCRCRRTTDFFVHPRNFAKMEIVPPTAGCRQTEIIITLKTRKTVCVKPGVKWIEKVIDFIKG